MSSSMTGTSNKAQLMMAAERIGQSVSVIIYACFTQRQSRINLQESEELSNVISTENGSKSSSTTKNVKQCNITHS